MAAIKISKKMKELEEKGGDPNEIRKLADQIPSSNTDDLVPCPYCNRKFAQNTAERHIPKCKDTVNRPKPPPTKDKLRNSQQNFNSPMKNNILKKSASPTYLQPPVSQS